MAVFLMHVDGFFGLGARYEPDRFAIASGQ